MYLISAEGYENANVEFLTIKPTSEIWLSVKDVGSGIGVKNISDLVLTLFRMGVGCQKGLPATIHWCKISSPYLVPVPNY